MENLRNIALWLRRHPFYGWACAVIMWTIAVPMQIVGSADDAVLLVQWVFKLGPIVLIPLGLAILAAVHLDQLKKYFSSPAFEIITRPSDSFPDAQNTVTAQLEVKVTNKARKKCAVRVIEVAPLLDGNILDGHGWLHTSYPPCYLQWSKQEHSAYGETRHQIDIPLGQSRRLNIATVNYGDENPHIQLSVPPGDRPPIHAGWNRVIIEIASEDDLSRPPERHVLLIGWTLERTDMDASVGLSFVDVINVDFWEPRGPRILERQREKGKKGNWNKQWQTSTLNRRRKTIDILATFSR